MLRSAQGASIGGRNMPGCRPARDRGPLPEGQLRPSRLRLGVPAKPPDRLQTNPAAWLRESTKVATKTDRPSAWGLACAAAGLDRFVSRLPVEALVGTHFHHGLTGLHASGAALPTQVGQSRLLPERAPTTPGRRVALRKTTLAHSPLAPMLTPALLAE